MFSLFLYLFPNVIDIYFSLRRNAGGAVSTREGPGRGAGAGAAKAGAEERGASPA